MPVQTYPQLELFSTGQDQQSPDGVQGGREGLVPVRTMGVSPTGAQVRLRGKPAVLHVIRSNRSMDVIKDVMTGHEGDFWVSDCYSLQTKSRARDGRLCLAHRLRDLQAVVARYPASFWPRAMQALFRSAVHLHNRRDHLSPPEFQVQRVERLCTWLLESSLERSEAKRLLKRYRKCRDCVFVFLHRSDVCPTNNISERYLRPSVVHRKVIGRFRSGWGAQTYAAIASIIATAALKNISSFQGIHRASSVLPHFPCQQGHE
ncbi:MAG: transposase [Anaerolineales bacterium]|nr:transposase [Anaerolineales bacterium]